MSDPKVFWYVLIPWPKAVYGTLHLTPQYSMNVPSLDPVKGHIHVKVSKRILNNFQNPGQIIRSSVEVPSQISHNFHIPSHSAQPAQATRFLLPNILMTKYQLLKNWNECRNYEFWKPTTRKEQDQNGIIDNRRTCKSVFKQQITFNQTFVGFWRVYSISKLIDDHVKSRV